MLHDLIDHYSDCRILASAIQEQVTAEIEKFDANYGFSYPRGVPDKYSFDVRRFTNNYLNRRGFPIRVFGHPRGGVYHNSGAVKPEFGFRRGILVSMRNKQGRIDLKGYFGRIQEEIEKVKK